MEAATTVSMEECFTTIALPYDPWSQATVRQVRQVRQVQKTMRRRPCPRIGPQWEEECEDAAAFHICRWASDRQAPARQTEGRSRYCCLHSLGSPNASLHTLLDPPRAFQKLPRNLREPLEVEETEPSDTGARWVDVMVRGPGSPIRRVREETRPRRPSPPYRGNCASISQTSTRTDTRMGARSASTYSATARHGQAASTQTDAVSASRRPLASPSLASHEWRRTRSE